MMSLYYKRLLLYIKEEKEQGYISQQWGNHPMRQESSGLYSKEKGPRKPRA